MSNIQSVSIIAAFPIGIVMIVIVASLMKDLKEFSKEPAKAAVGKDL